MMSSRSDPDPNKDPSHVDADEYSSSPPSDNPAGALIVTAYAKRNLRAYPVLASELKNLSMLNTLSTISFSSMGAFISFAVGIKTNAFFVERPPPEGIILSNVVAPASLVLAVIAFVLGIWAIRSKSSTWSDIRQESSGQG